jgi:hypothetical protein
VPRSTPSCERSCGTHQVPLSTIQNENHINHISISCNDEAMHKRHCALTSLHNTTTLNYTVAQSIDCITYTAILSHCTALHSTASHHIPSTISEPPPHCNKLSHTAPHCTLLHSTALYCTLLHYAALHSTALYCTLLLHCTLLHSTAALHSPSCLRGSSRSRGRLRWSRPRPRAPTGSRH